MGGIHSTHRYMRKAYIIFIGKLKRKDYLGDQGVHGRYNMNLKETGCGLDSTGSR
jgi:hypothetical protein